MLKRVFKIVIYIVVISAIPGCSSPYPIDYSLKWPFLYLCPSVENHTGIKRAPMTKSFNDRDLESKVKLVFVGDLMVSNGDRIPDYSEKVKKVLNSASLIIANCESPVSDEIGQKKNYLLKFLMPLDYLTGITTNQVDKEWVLSLANNHIGDQGYDGFKKTVQSVSNADRMRVFGIRESGGKLPFYRLNVGDITIGLVSWTRWMNEKSSFNVKEKERVYIQADIFGEDEETCNIDWNSVKDSAKKDKEDIDLIIAYPHWDWEFQHFPHQDTVNQASSLIDCGVDLIVGTHSHTLQAMEQYSCTDKMCFYGLGNFIGLTRSKATKMSAMLEIRLSKDNANTPAIITGYTLYPTIQIDDAKESRIVLMSEYEGKDKQFYKERLRLMYNACSKW